MSRPEDFDMAAFLNPDLGEADQRASRSTSSVGSSTTGRLLGDDNCLREVEFEIISQRTKKTIANTLVVAQRRTEDGVLRWAHFFAILDTKMEEVVDNEGSAYDVSIIPRLQDPHQQTTVRECLLAVASVLLKKSVEKQFGTAERDAEHVEGDEGRAAATVKEVPVILSDHLFSQRYNQAEVEEGRGSSSSIGERLVQLNLLDYLRYLINPKKFAQQEAASTAAGVGAVIEGAAPTLFGSVPTRYEWVGIPVEWKYHNLVIFLLLTLLALLLLSILPAYLADDAVHNAEKDATDTVESVAISADSLYGQLTHVALQFVRSSAVKLALEVHRSVQHFVQLSRPSRLAAQNDMLLSIAKESFVVWRNIEIDSFERKAAMMVSASRRIPFITDISRVMTRKTAFWNASHTVLWHRVDDLPSAARIVGSANSTRSLIASLCSPLTVADITIPRDDVFSISCLEGALPNCFLSGALGKLDEQPCVSVERSDGLHVTCLHRMAIDLPSQRHDELFVCSVNVSQWESNFLQRALLEAVGKSFRGVEATEELGDHEFKVATAIAGPFGISAQSQIYSSCCGEIVGNSTSNFVYSSGDVSVTRDVISFLLVDGFSRPITEYNRSKSFEVTQFVSAENETEQLITVTGVIGFVNVVVSSNATFRIAVVMYTSKVESKLHFLRKAADHMSQIMSNQIEGVAGTNEEPPVSILFVEMKNETSASMSGAGLAHVYDSVGERNVKTQFHNHLIAAAVGNTGALQSYSISGQMVVGGYAPIPALGVSIVVEISLASVKMSALEALCGTIPVLEGAVQHLMVQAVTRGAQGEIYQLCSPSTRVNASNFPFAPFSALTGVPISARAKWHGETRITHARKLSWTPAAIACAVQFSDQGKGRSLAQGWGVLVTAICCAATSFVIYTVARAFVRRIVSDKASAQRNRKEAAATDQEAFLDVVRDFIPLYLQKRVEMGERLFVHNFPRLTFVVTDICQMSSRWEEDAGSIRMLAYLFMLQDGLANYYNLFKLHTVGDSYICVGGLPDEEQEGNERVVDESYQMQVYRSVSFSCLVQLLLTNVFRHVPEKTPSFLVFSGGEVREALKMPAITIGIHCGPCLAGVIEATSTPHFECWGPTFVLARRMADTAAPSRIQISGPTREALLEVDHTRVFEFESRQKKIIAGFGTLTTFTIRSTRLQVPREILEWLGASYAVRRQFHTMEGLSDAPGDAASADGHFEDEGSSSGEEAPEHEPPERRKRSSHESQPANKLLMPSTPLGPSESEPAEQELNSQQVNELHTSSSSSGYIVD